MVDGAFQQEIRLLLRSFSIQALDLMFGKNGGRSWLRLPLQRQETSDLLKGGPGTAGGKENRQQDPHRNRKQNTPASSPWINGLVRLRIRALRYGAVFLHRLGARISLPGMHGRESRAVPRSGKVTVGYFGYYLLM